MAAAHPEAGPGVLGKVVDLTCNPVIQNPEIQANIHLVGTLPAQVRHTNLRCDQTRNISVSGSTVQCK